MFLYFSLHTPGPDVDVPPVDYIAVVSIGEQVITSVVFQSAVGMLPLL
jgi:hypothetical protein